MPSDLLYVWNSSVTLYYRHEPVLDNNFWLAVTRILFRFESYVYIICIHKHPKDKKTALTFTHRQIPIYTCTPPPPHTHTNTWACRYTKWMLNSSFHFLFRFDEVFCNRCVISVVVIFVDHGWLVFFSLFFFFSLSLLSTSHFIGAMMQLSNLSISQSTHDISNKTEWKSCWRWQHREVIVCCIHLHSNSFNWSTGDKNKKILYWVRNGSGHIHKLIAKQQQITAEITFLKWTFSKIAGLSAQNCVYAVIYFSQT